MKIAIFGIGGVGGYFGGMLARQYPDVSFIARGKHLAAIREHGLKLTSDLGEFLIHPALATNNPAEIGVVDVVVVAVKTWQVEEVAQQMRPLVGEQTTIIPLLNGVEAPAKLAAVYGWERVLGGFCRVMSQIESAGHVRQGSFTPFVAFGEIDKTLSQRVQDLKSLFEKAAIHTEASADIEAAMWQKLVFIAAFGGVGSVTRAPAGVLRQIPQTYQMLRDAMQEIVDVARARGINMAADAVEKGMATFDGVPDGGTASMQRDIMEGRPSELDGQIGAVVRLSAEVGIPTPVHQFIYTTLLPTEMTARALLK